MHVTTAWDWPSDDQFQTADVIVAYCYLDWTEDRLAQVRRYLEDGGGLVLIHSATWTKPKPSPDVGRVIGIGGFQLFRHGPVRLEIAAPEHPICSGLPDTIVLDDDETYWPPTPMIDSVMVLATSIEEEEEQGDPRRRPPSRCSGATNLAADAYSAACRAIASRPSTIQCSAPCCFEGLHGPRVNRHVDWIRWRKPKPTLSDEGVPECSASEVSIRATSKRRSHK